MYTHVCVCMCLCGCIDYNVQLYDLVLVAYICVNVQLYTSCDTSCVVCLLTSHAKASDVKENGDDQEPSKAVSTSPAPKRKQPSLKGPSPLETSARPAQVWHCQWYFLICTGISGSVVLYIVLVIQCIYKHRR